MCVIHAFVPSFVNEHCNQKEEQDAFESERRDPAIEEMLIYRPIQRMRVRTSSRETHGPFLRQCRLQRGLVTEGYLTAHQTLGSPQQG